MFNNILVYHLLYISINEEKNIMKISSTKFGTKVRCPIGVHLMLKDRVKPNNIGEYKKRTKAFIIKDFAVS